MTTTQTVILVGGVAVGAFILVKMMSPTKVAPKGAPAPNSSLQGIIGNVAAIGAGLTSLFDRSGSEVTGYTPHGPTASDVAAAGFTSGSNVTVTDGFMFTDDQGHFIAG